MIWRGSSDRTHSGLDHQSFFSIILFSKEWQRAFQTQMILSKPRTMLSSLGCSNGVAQLFLTRYKSMTIEGLVLGEELVRESEISGLCSTNL